MSGSLTHTAPATFTFKDFTLSATPSSLSINTGGQGTSTISLNLLNGFGSIVALSVSSPTGVTGALSTATISGSGASTLTISPATVGSYTVVVTGTSGSLTRTRSLTISVGTHVSPILTAPSTETVVQTSTVTFAVTATDSSVPTSSLTLSANQLPLDSSFATIQGTSPVSGMFTWTPTTADAPGTYAVSFIVTNGVSSAQTYVIITLVSANVLPIITVPGRLTRPRGQTFTSPYLQPTLLAREEQSYFLLRGWRRTWPLIRLAESSRSRPAQAKRAEYSRSTLLRPTATTPLGRERSPYPFMS